MKMNNSTNESFFFQPPIDASSIAIFAGDVFSLLLSILAFSITYLTRASMNRFELYTLLILNSVYILGHMNNTFMTIERIFFPELISDCFDAALGHVDAALRMFADLCFLYYSLLQTSTLSRVKPVLVLFRITHNLKTLVIFHVFAVLLNLSETFLVLDFYKTDCQEADAASVEFGILILYTQLMVPRSLCLILYMVAAIFVFYNRFKQNQGKSRSKYGAAKTATDLARLKRLRRNIHLVLKLFVLSLFSTLSDLTLILPLLIKHFLLGPMLYQFITYFVVFIYDIQPIFMIFVHNGLKKTLVGLIKNISYSFFCLNK